MKNLIFLHPEINLGKDLGSIMGKTTRQKPAPVPTDYFDVPGNIIKLHKDVTLAADIMFVNEIPFFITTSRDIKFTSVEHLKNRQQKSIQAAILKVCNLYA